MSETLHGSPPDPEIVDILFPEPEVGDDRRMFGPKVLSSNEAEQRDSDEALRFYGLRGYQTSANKLVEMAWGAGKLATKVAKDLVKRLINN